MNMNIDSLTTIIANVYPHDSTVPDVTVAYLRAERKFYASIVRYADPHKPKQVVQRAHGRSAVEAIDNLYLAWASRDARDDLGTHNTRGCNDDVYDRGNGDQSPPPPSKMSPKGVVRDLLNEHAPVIVKFLTDLENQIINLRKQLSDSVREQTQLADLIAQIVKRNHEERDVRLRERLATVALQSVISDRKVVAHDTFEIQRVANAAVGYADAVIERLRAK